MMYTVFETITQYETIGGDMPARLSKAGLVEVFKELIDEYADDHKTFNQALFFIMHVYSLDSELHTLHTDWALIKQTAAKRVGMDPESDFYHDLLGLRKRHFTLVIQKYLDHQQSRAFKHLVMLKDLYNQMLNSAMSPMRTGAEETMIDWDQKYKNSQYSDKLYLQIGEWEQRVKEETAKISKGTAELHEAVKKNPAPVKQKALSLRTEDNAPDDYR